MKASMARRMAWSIGILSIALMVAGLLFMFVDRHTILPHVSDSWTFSSVFDVVVSIAVPVIGLVIASRRRENPLGWLLLAAGLVLGVVTFSRAYALYALVANPGSLPAGRAFAWLSNWMWTIPVSLLPFLFLLFPTGRLPAGRWRPVAWFCGAVLVLLTASALVLATTKLVAPVRGGDLARLVDRRERSDRGLPHRGLRAPGRVPAVLRGAPPEVHPREG